MSARRCRTCGETRPVGEFASPHGKRCSTCAEKHSERTHRRCYTCREHVAVEAFSSGTAKACDACKALVDDRRRCVTCKELKPPERFASSRARSCTACKRRHARAKCERCGGIAGPAQGGGPRRFCDDCLPAVFTDLARASAAARSAKVAARTAKRCPGCALTKPLTAEHWSPGGGDTPGKRWDSHCKACRAAVAADKLANDAGYRARQIARQNRAYAAHRARRAADSAYDAAVRARKRKWDRAYQDRKRAGAKPARVHERPRNADMPLLPAAPLGAVIACRAELHPEGLRGYCMVIGVSDRDVRAWRGERSSVQFDVADRAVTRMGVCWWDVWADEESGYEIARAAFEGEQVAA